MRRIFTLFLCAALLICLGLSVSAAPEMSKITVQAVLSPDGSCQVSASGTVHLEQGTQALQFPLPADAADVSLNGSRARTHSSGSIKYIDLSEISGSMTGDFSFQVSYNLPNQVVKTKSDLLELQLPVLSGFAYVTKEFSFTATLPGAVTGKPRFSSGYHQTGIEEDLTISTDGAAISAQSTKELKDHETLTMLLPVTEEMFPQALQEPPDLKIFLLAGILFAVLAVGYWLMFLHHLPQWGKRRVLPPEGCTAGEIRSLLYLQGADLTAMVFSWAQLGYVMIQPDKKGNVMLHKQMDMGNERSSFERRAFSSLFGRRSIVDATGSHYGELALKVSKSIPNIQDYVENKSGNLKVFQVLFSGIGLACGAVMGYLLIPSGSTLQLPVTVILGILGGWAVYAMMPWACYVFQPHRRPLWRTLILALAFLVLGKLSGSLLPGLIGAFAGFAGGLLLAFAGIRTDAGRQAIDAIVGLRRYMRTVSRQELHARCEENPAYFFELAPYALAMGADRQFARRFGRIHLPDCPYIYCQQHTRYTATQWSEEIRRIAGLMNSHSRSVLHNRRSAPRRPAPPARGTASGRSHSRRTPPRK